MSLKKEIESSSPSAPHFDRIDRNFSLNNDCRSMTIDPEKNDRPIPKEKVSVYKSLGWLDRFLAVWILLAMIVGVLLGNFVPKVGPALNEGKFVRVSVPIGMCLYLSGIGITC